MKHLGVLLCILLTAGLALLPAQDFLGGGRDFLTPHEADLIRVAQEPNERIEQYLHFARLRIELVRQTLLKDDAARSKLIHQNLEEYGRIIEAVDLVVDDAAADKIDVTKGLGLLAEQEKEFLAVLEKIQEEPADDSWAYEFVLEDSIEITRDSVELAKEDLGDRGRRIAEADADEKARQRTLMTPERQKDMAKAERKVEEAKQKETSKRPTLLKPGEDLSKPREQP
ncbi:MAG TPA: hypothetical protein VML01_01055 [Bryobacterales bacterium]|nr:hypothetical protein [Bryobacterales bacterium]